MRVFFQPHNQGKGAAVWRGIGESTGDMVVMQECGYVNTTRASIPAWSARLSKVKPTSSTALDSLAPRAGIDASRNFWHSVGNWMLTTLSNMFSDLNLTDMETCYKVIVRPIASRLDLQSKDFGIEPEITLKVARLRARIYEVPMLYHGRTYEEGKKIGSQGRLQGSRRRVYDSPLLAVATVGKGSGSRQ